MNIEIQIQEKTRLIPPLGGKFNTNDGMLYLARFDNGGYCFVNSDSVIKDEPCEFLSFENLIARYLDRQISYNGNLLMVESGTVFLTTTRKVIHTIQLGDLFKGFDKDNECMLIQVKEQFTLLNLNKFTTMICNSTIEILMDNIYRYFNKIKFNGNFYPYKLI